MGGCGASWEIRPVRHRLTVLQKYPDRCTAGHRSFPICLRMCCFGQRPRPVTSPRVRRCRPMYWLLSGYFFSVVGGLPRQWRSGLGEHALTVPLSQLRMSSISIFQMEVRRLMRTTLRGHACKMPLVARHYSPRLPASQKARCSCRYMAARACSVPLSMPSSRATRSTTACGIMSKHLT